MDNSDLQFVNLSITTYQGLSLGATHWYAELQGEKYRYELSFPLTPPHAARLNKDSGYRAMKWRAGDLYKGFDNYEHIFVEAKYQWKEKYPEAKYLVLGRVGVGGPKSLIDSVFNDNDLKCQVEAVITKCEKIDWYANPANDHLMDKYYQQWITLLIDKISGCPDI